MTAPHPLFRDEKNKRKNEKRERENEDKKRDMYLVVCRPDDAMTVGFEADAGVWSKGSVLSGSSLMLAVSVGPLIHPVIRICRSLKSPAGRTNLTAKSRTHRLRLGNAHQSLTRTGFDVPTPNWRGILSRRLFRGVFLEGDFVR